MAKEANRGLKFLDTRSEPIILLLLLLLLMLLLLLPLPPFQGGVLAAAHPALCPEDGAEREV